MKTPFDEQRERVERFARGENVARFRRMLESKTNESERKILSDFIDQGMKRQRDAADFGLGRPRV
jgi:hypothetical protein